MLRTEADNESYEAASLMSPVNSKYVSEDGLPIDIHAKIFNETSPLGSSGFASRSFRTPSDKEGEALSASIPASPPRQLSRLSPFLPGRSVQSQSPNHDASTGGTEQPPRLSLSVPNPIQAPPAYTHPLPLGTMPTSPVLQARSFNVIPPSPSPSSPSIAPLAAATMRSSLIAPTVTLAAPSARLIGTSMSRPSLPSGPPGSRSGSVFARRVPAPSSTPSSPASITPTSPPCAASPPPDLKLAPADVYPRVLSSSLLATIPDARTTFAHTSPPRLSPHSPTRPRSPFPSQPLSLLPERSRSHSPSQSQSQSGLDHAHAHAHAHGRSSTMLGDELSHPRPSHSRSSLGDVASDSFRSRSLMLPHLPRPHVSDSRRSSFLGPPSTAAPPAPNDGEDAAPRPLRPLHIAPTQEPPRNADERAPEVLRVTMRHSPPFRPRGSGDSPILSFRQLHAPVRSLAPPQPASPDTARASLFLSPAPMPPPLQLDSPELPTRPLVVSPTAPTAPTTPPGLRGSTRPSAASPTAPSVLSSLSTLASTLTRDRTITRIPVVPTTFGSSQHDPQLLFARVAPFVAKRKPVARPQKPSSADAGPPAAAEPLPPLLPSLARPPIAPARTTTLPLDPPAATTRTTTSDAYPARGKLLPRARPPPASAPAEKPGDEHEPMLVPLRPLPLPSTSSAVPPSPPLAAAGHASLLRRRSVTHLASRLQQHRRLLAGDHSPIVESLPMPSRPSSSPPSPSPSSPAPTTSPPRLPDVPIDAPTPPAQPTTGMSVMPSHIMQMLEPIEALSLAVSNSKQAMEAQALRRIKSVIATHSLEQWFQILAKPSNKRTSEECLSVAEFLLSLPRRSALLRTLPPRLLAKVCQHLRLEVFAEHQCVYTQGDVADIWYCIVRGSVSCFVQQQPLDVGQLPTVYGHLKHVMRKKQAPPELRSLTGALAGRVSGLANGERRDKLTAQEEDMLRSALGESHPDWVYSLQAGDEFGGVDTGEYVRSATVKASADCILVTMPMALYKQCLKYTEDDMDEQLHKRKFLKQTHPFTTLAPQMCSLVRQHMRRIDLRRTEALYQQGEPVDGVYFIAEGEVMLTQAVRMPRSGVDTSRLVPEYQALSYYNTATKYMPFEKRMAQRITISSKGFVALEDTSSIGSARLVRGLTYELPVVKRHVGSMVGHEEALLPIQAFALPAHTTIDTFSDSEDEGSDDSDEEDTMEPKSEPPTHPVSSNVAAVKAPQGAAAAAPPQVIVEAALPSVLKVAPTPAELGITTPPLATDSVRALPLRFGCMVGDNDATFSNNGLYRGTFHTPDAMARAQMHKRVGGIPRRLPSTFAFKAKSDGEQAQHAPAKRPDTPPHPLQAGPPVAQGTRLRDGFVVTASLLTPQFIYHCTDANAYARTDVVKLSLSLGKEEDAYSLRPKQKAKGRNKERAKEKEPEPDEEDAISGLSSDVTDLAPTSTRSLKCRPPTLQRTLGQCRPPPRLHSSAESDSPSTTMRAPVMSGSERQHDSTPSPTRVDEPTPPTGGEQDATSILKRVPPPCYDMLFAPGAVSPPLQVTRVKAAAIKSATANVPRMRSSHVRHKASTPSNLLEYTPHRQFSALVTSQTATIYFLPLSIMQRVFRGARKQLLVSAAFAEVHFAKQRVVEAAGIPVTDFHLFALEAASEEAQNLARRLKLLNHRQQKHVLRQAIAQSAKFASHEAVAAQLALKTMGSSAAAFALPAAGGIGGGLTTFLQVLAAALHKEDPAAAAQLQAHQGTTQRTPGSAPSSPRSGGPARAPPSPRMAALASPRAAMVSHGHHPLLSPRPDGPQLFTPRSARPTAASDARMGRRSSMAHSVLSSLLGEDTNHALASPLSSAFDPLHMAAKRLQLPESRNGSPSRPGSRPPTPPSTDAAQVLAIAPGKHVSTTKRLSWARDAISSLFDHELNSMPQSTRRSSMGPSASLLSPLASRAPSLFGAATPIFSRRSSLAGTPSPDISPSPPTQTLSQTAATSSLAAPPSATDLSRLLTQQRTAKRIECGVHYYQPTDHIPRNKFGFTGAVNSHVSLTRLVHIITQNVNRYQAMFNNKSLRVAEMLRRAGTRKQRSNTALAAAIARAEAEGQLKPWGLGACAGDAAQLHGDAERIARPSGMPLAREGRPAKKRSMSLLGTDEEFAEAYEALTDAEPVPDTVVLKSDIVRDSMQRNTWLDGRLHNGFVQTFTALPPPAPIQEQQEEEETLCAAATSVATCAPPKPNTTNRAYCPRPTRCMEGVRDMRQRGGAVYEEPKPTHSRRLTGRRTVTLPAPLVTTSRVGASGVSSKAGRERHLARALARVDKSSLQDYESGTGTYREIVQELERVQRRKRAKEKVNDSVQRSFASSDPFARLLEIHKKLPQISAANTMDSNKVRQNVFARYGATGVLEQRLEATSTAAWLRHRPQSQLLDRPTVWNYESWIMQQQHRMK